MLYYFKSKDFSKIELFLTWKKADGLMEAEKTKLKPIDRTNSADGSEPDQSLDFAWAGKNA